MRESRGDPGGGLTPMTRTIALAVAMLGLAASVPPAWSQQAPGREPNTTPSAGGREVPGRPATGGTARPQAEVVALIDRVGRTPPEWFAATPLEYPKTLDLAWPEPAPG